jgi:hypothetical protein
MAQNKNDRQRERRVHPRKACEISALVQINFWGPKNSFMEKGTIVNISSGGVLISMPKQDAIDVKWPDEFSLLRLYALESMQGEEAVPIIDCEPRRVVGMDGAIHIGAGFLQSGPRSAKILGEDFSVAPA